MVSLASIAVSHKRRCVGSSAAANLGTAELRLRKARCGRNSPFCEKRLTIPVETNSKL